MLPYASMKTYRGHKDFWEKRKRQERQVKIWEAYLKKGGNFFFFVAFLLAWECGLAFMVPGNMQP